MKNHSIKFITAIALAVVFTLSAMYSTVYAVTRADVPQSYSLENFFNVEYGDREENVTAGGGEPGDGLWFEPEIYAITPSGDIYAADTYNPVAHMPVKQFDSTGKYIRTIPCSTFTNGDITGMTVLGNTLCVLTSDNYLCAFNIETGEVTKHIADVPEGFDYYSMVTVGNCAAIIYDRFNDIENSYGFYELKFLTFDTVLQSFVPSDDIISVSARVDGFKLISEIRFGEFSITVNELRSICDIPLGLSKDGNLLIKHHLVFGEGDVFGEYDKNGNRVNYANYNWADDFRRYESVYNNEIFETWTEWNYRMNYNELVIAKMVLQNGEFTNNAVTRIAMNTYDSTEENPDIREDRLTELLELYISSAPTDGPKRYAVTENGDIWILDDMRADSPIKHFSSDGKYIDTITSRAFTGYNDGFTYIISKGNDLYVNTYGKLFKYDTETGEITDYGPIYIDSEDSEFARSWLNIGKYIVQDGYGTHPIIWAFDTEKGKFSADRHILDKSYNADNHLYIIKIGSTEYKIPVGSEINTVHFNGLDKDGNIIVEYFADEGSSYRRYSKEGKLTGFMPMEYDSDGFYIGSGDFVTNGEFIWAHSTREVYSLDRVVFNDDYFKNAYDINFDGAENTADAVAILKYSAEMITFDMAQEVKADINGDFKTNTTDAVAVLRFCAGM